MEIIQTHPMVNKWGEGTAGECGFGAVTELNKTNPGSQQSFFSICTVHDGGRGGGIRIKSQKTPVKIYLLFSLILTYFWGPIKGGSLGKI